MTNKRIGVLVVAYNAANTLAQVLDRIPDDFRPRIDTILVGDDHSSDQTHLIAVGYQQMSNSLPISVTRHPRNLGYGGNQKWGYQQAIDLGLDVIVLLHGDGQYAPEMLGDMVAPILEDRADAVFGSRMTTPGGARKGGMPMYKYVGNRILTTYENAVAGARLTEWHSGYRAYSVAALARLPFQRNSDGFDFDTQIILQLLETGQRIVEIPIPTYYGDEISHVNGLKYAKDISFEVARYRAHKMGFGSGELAFASNAYEEKLDIDSSHVVLRNWILGGDRHATRSGRILDLGCSDGTFSAPLRGAGFHVTGVDVVEHPEVTDHVDRFVMADLDRGLPDDLQGPFDIIVAADVIEHVRDPAALLDDLHRQLAPNGSLLLSVPNFGHWYPRIRTALGLFDYDRRGILDNDHVRFFTRRSLDRLIRRSGYTVVRRHTTGLPLGVARRGTDHGDEALKGHVAAGGRASEDTGTASGTGRLGWFVRAVDRILIALRPQLFGYQFLLELRSDRPEASRDTRGV